MLLRRMIKHVEDQNWFAIGIDFVIVVTGVFLGIQLGNWNDARAEKRAYEHAIERYIAESRTNLERLDAFDEQMQSALSNVSQGIDALQKCEQTTDTSQILRAAFRTAAGTFGLSIQTSALVELTSTPELLAQQTDDIRLRFADTKYRADIFLREASLIELMPLEERLQNLSSLRVGALENLSSNYAGADYSRPQRPIGLAIPFEDACQDEALIKALYTWERWQGALPAVSRILREDLEANLAALEEK